MPGRAVDALLWRAVLGKIQICRTYTAKAAVTRGRAGLTQRHLLPLLGACHVPAQSLIPTYYAKNFESNERRGTLKSSQLSIGSLQKAYTRLATTEQGCVPGYRQRQPNPTLLSPRPRNIQTLKTSQPSPSTCASLGRRLITTTNMASISLDATSNGSTAPKQVFFLLVNETPQI